ncbi:MAG: hypothetical protein LWW93_17880 [Hyphomicrobiales bacterium]|nr:hypothetical protein [Hyphomicrobiales bacterium]
MSDVVVASAVRTVVGTPSGALASFPSANLGAIVVREAIGRAGLRAEDVDEVIFADELDGGDAPIGVAPGGLNALALALERFAAGDVEVVVAAARSPVADRVVVHPSTALGVVEAIAGRRDLTRIELENYALTSRLRAAAAARDGRFADEIVPVNGAASARLGAAVRDENLWSSAALVLPEPRPAAWGEGKATAAMVAPPARGAAALVLMRSETVARRGSPDLARLAAAAVAPTSCDAVETAFVNAAHAAMDVAGWRLPDLDLVECDEPTAGHALVARRDLGVDLAAFNVLGGALAFGRPCGACDLRMLVTLLHEMRRREARRGLVACDDAGLGRAVCVERR